MRGTRRGWRRVEGRPATSDEPAFLALMPVGYTAPLLRIRSPWLPPTSPLHPRARIPVPAAGTSPTPSLLDPTNPARSVSGRMTHPSSAIPRREEEPIGRRWFRRRRTSARPEHPSIAGCFAAGDLAPRTSAIPAGARGVGRRRTRSARRQAWATGRATPAIRRRSTTGATRTGGGRRIWPGEPATRGVPRRLVARCHGSGRRWMNFPRRPRSGSRCSQAQANAGGAAL